MNYHLCAQTKQRWYVVVGSQRRLRHPINYLRENGQMIFFVSFFFENHVVFCDETFKRTPIITTHKFDIFSQTTWFFFQNHPKAFPSLNENINKLIRRLSYFILISLSLLYTHLHPYFRHFKPTRAFSFIHCQSSCVKQCSSMRNSFLPRSNITNIIWKRHMSIFLLLLNDHSIFSNISFVLYECVR